MWSWLSTPPACAAAVASRRAGNRSPVSVVRGPRLRASRTRRRASFCEIRNRIRSASGQDFAPIWAGVVWSHSAVIAACSTVGSRFRASWIPEHTSSRSAVDRVPQGSARTSSIAARTAASLAATTDSMIRTYILLIRLSGLAVSEPTIGVARDRFNLELVVRVVL